jgi:hypothetical protein
MKTFWQTVVWGALAGLVIGSSALFRAHAETPDQRVNVCYALRHGVNVVDIETRLAAAGYTPTDAGTLAGRMLRDHCPELINEVAKQVGYE